MRIALAMFAILALSLAPAALRADAADTSAVSNAVSGETTLINGTSTAPANKDTTGDTIIVNATSAIPAHKADTGNAIIVNGAGETPEEETVTPVAKPVINAPEGLTVKVGGGLLSVNAKDQQFGLIIGAIANAAGFEVDLSNDVYAMTLSTRFENSNIKRGILRLLSLIGQRNYTMDYAPDGSIKKLEVYGDLSSGTREITAAQPTVVTTPSTPVNRTPMRPKTPVTVIRDTSRDSGSTSGSQSQTEKEEPQNTEKVIELDYSVRKVPSEESSTDTSATDTSTDTSSQTSSGDTSPGDTSGDEYIEPEIIPEGDIPPADELMSAPLMKESTPPAQP